MRRPIYFVYNAALLLLTPIIGAMLALRLAKGRSRAGWSERWGHLSVSPAQGRRRIWFHAASVGEVMAATPILQAYHQICPGDDLVLSVITPGGHEVGRGLLNMPLSAVFYAPFDAPWVVKRTLQRLHPSVLVVLETELWPNLFCLSRRSGARILLANARISDRSIGRYLRLRRLFGWTLGLVDRALAQTGGDAQRLISIGAPPEKVEVFGNAKFDQVADRLTDEAREALRSTFRLAPDAPVFVVGSTRTPDEEEIILQAYLLARVKLPNLVLIHAPRHVERADQVVEMMRRQGLTPRRRTELGDCGEHGEAAVEQVILDTFGELGKVYALADAVFIGNSLTAPGGGQNLLQPLSQGKVVLHGPYMQNFRDIVEMANRAGVACSVRTAEELADGIVRLSQDPARGELAERAVGLIESNRGAAARYAQAIAALADDVERQRHAD